MKNPTINGRPVAATSVYREGDYWRARINMQDGTCYLDGANVRTRDEAEAVLRAMLDQTED